MGVVYQAHQRAVRRQQGQQAQERQADQEPVRRRSLAEAEGDAERVALRRRKSLRPAQHGLAELVQRAAREFGLGLGTGAAQHLVVRHPAGEVLEQGGLAEAWLAVDDQRAALTRANVLGEPVERTAFRAAAVQFRRAPLSRATHRCLHDLTLTREPFRLSTVISLHCQRGRTGPASGSPASRTVRSADASGVSTT